MIAAYGSKANFMPDSGQQSRVASVEEVEAFLKTLKALVSLDDFRVDPRNYAEMSNLGVNIQGVGITLRALTPRDYSEGPMADRDTNREGNVWIFGANVEGTLVYIKCRLERENVICLSFHPARQAMRFPHR